MIQADSFSGEVYYDTFNGSKKHLNQVLSRTVLQILTTPDSTDSGMWLKQCQHLRLDKNLCNENIGKEMAWMGI